MNSIDPASKVLPTLLIIELDYHAEVLSAICPILARKFNLVLWTTDKIWNKIVFPEGTLVSVWIMPKKMSPKRYFVRQKAIFEGIDLIYFSTLEKHFPFFSKLNYPCPVIMRIHNVNASLFPTSSIDWSLGRIHKILSYILRKVMLARWWYFRDRLYKKVDCLMLPGPAILEQVKQEHPQLPYRKLAPYCLPFFSLPEEHFRAVETDEIVFAVTGSVDPERKDYSVLAEAIEHYKLMQTRPIRLLFLGKPKGRAGREIAQSFKQLIGHPFYFECFESYVPQDVVDEKMKTVHFLIAPMKLKTQHKIHFEYYGKTKVSGVEADLMLYRKPVLLPVQYRLPKEMQAISETYSDAQQLYEGIIRLGINGSWAELTPLFNSMTEYSQEVIALHFHEVYQSLK